jgi:hypothetical protein
MSEKSLMVESKEDEAERLHFQKVTILQVESTVQLSIWYSSSSDPDPYNIGPHRSGS